MGNSQILFIAGHARLPEGMAAQNMYETITVTAEVDRVYGVVLEASCTLATEHGRDYIGKILKGFSLRHDIEEVIKCIEEQYYGKAANAIIAALKDLHYQFQQVKQVQRPC
ncbi:DUF3870 domain-containing protein [Halobacillus amylolyticus]|uniref:DUF3870 domain-containing protein n=1 Tax=Halobacillus amylolyticus TaxID=2932259 RepID=A0ABY4H9E4_9BACI|nr:DUF3870 domain-containing protein [Halobacillus amylolyticus]UOR11485.1 DUF3870 domain-containing protein [Halobacillus amylolyticus]